MAFIKYSEGKINSVVKEGEVLTEKENQGLKRAKDALEKYKELKSGKLSKESN